MEPKAANESHVSATAYEHSALESKEVVPSEENNYQDARDMRRLGNKQELKVNISIIIVKPDKVVGD